MNKINYNNMADILDTVFNNCLIKPSEVSLDFKPLCDYVIGIGLKDDFAFNLKRLNFNKLAIETLLEELPNLSNPKYAINLTLNRKGIRWGGLSDVEKLVALGVATENLFYLLDPKFSGEFAVIQKVEKKLQADPNIITQPTN